MLTALAAVGALYFNTNQTSEALRATRDQIGLSEQGQLTDRFSKAVEQLGTKDRLEVRLGGIYALERIARDSARDHPTVMEVLSAYVREHTLFLMCSGTEPMARLTTDVQAILTVIGRRDNNRDRDALDLSGTCLANAYLPGANFTNVYLYEANLTNAYLPNANLTTRPSAARTSPTRTSTARTSPTRTSTARTSPTRPSSARTSPTQSSSARTSPTRTSSARTSSARTSSARTSSARTSSARTLPARTSAARTSPARTSAARTSPARTSPTPAVFDEVRRSSRKMVSYPGGTGSRCVHFAHYL